VPDSGKRGKRRETEFGRTSILLFFSLLAGPHEGVKMEELGKNGAARVGFFGQNGVAERGDDLRTERGV
jgi:hypothetical protein